MPARAIPTRRRHIRPLLRTAGAAGGALAAATAATYVAMRRSGQQGPVGSADAIVVFGAGLTRLGPTPLLQARLDRAAELYSADHAPTIWCSGGKAEVDAMRAALTAESIPPEAIAADEHGLSTRHTLRGLARYRGRRVLLVSSRHHMLRIVAEARRQGLEPVACPAAATVRKGLLRRRVKQQLREILAVWWYGLTGTLARMLGKPS